MARHARIPVIAATLTILIATCGGDRDDAASSTIDTTATSAPSASAPDQQRQALLDTARRDYGAPRAMAIIRLGGGEWFGASGTANLNGTPIERTSRFRIASITKPIVAALVLDSVARGELALDAAVESVVSGVLQEPKVTVRMLLDHTSGIFDVGNEGDTLADIEALTDPDLREEADAVLAAYEAGEGVIASPQLFVALAEIHDRYFGPGAGYHYSNANYQVAGMVLEAATGRTLSQLLEERIVARLGLEHTTIAPPDLGSPEIRGYGTSVDDGSPVDITDELVAFGNGASGGVVSTVDELLDVMQAIVRGDIVEGDLLADMIAPTARSNNVYGLGIATYHLSCGEYLGHEGGVNGTAPIALVSHDAGDGVVIVMNLRGAGDPGLPRLADMLLCGAR